MKRSTSHDPFTSAKMAKHVHNPQDDDGAGGGFPLLPGISIDDHFACHPPTFHVDPFPVRPEPDSKLYLKEAWNMLQPAINIIFKDSYKPGSFPCTRIYRAVVRACVTNSGQTLFNLIKDECEPHISAALLSLERQSSDLSVFLPLVEKCWLEFRRKMMFVSDLAMYETCNGSSLWDMGKGLFQKHLSLASPIQDKVIAGILGLITDERSGKTTANNTSLLKNLMDMFHGQQDVFEKPFLDSTSQFYASEAEQVLQRSDISQYLKYVERSLCEEEKKCEEDYYFFASCWSPLMKVVVGQLLEVHACVLEKGFTLFMDEGRMDDLRRMYGLFSRANLVAYMDRILKSYIREKGAKEDSLKELHTNIDKIWHQCFKDDILLDKSIRECFEGLGLHVPVLDEYSDEVPCLEE